MNGTLNTGGWIKSSYCKPGGNECVEVSIGTHEIKVRDSKDRSGGQLTFTRAEWAAFVAGTQAGEFDPQ